MQIKKIIVAITFWLFLFNLNAQVEKLAILDFEILANSENSEEYSWLSIGFAESLSDAFSRVGKFKMVERSQLNKVLTERQNTHINQNDSSVVLEIGRLLSVDKVLLGSCQITTGHFLVNFRLVDVSTGEIDRMDGLQVMGSLDSILYIQNRICVNIAQEYGGVPVSDHIKKDIQDVTSGSTENLLAYKYLNKGIMFFENEQFEDAIEMYTLAIEEDKKYSKAFFKRGQTNSYIGNYQDAAQDYIKSDEYVKFDSVYSLVGEAYYMSGDFKKAKKYFEKVIEANPNNVRATDLLNQSKINLHIESNIDKNQPTDSLKFLTVYDYNNGIAKAYASNGKFGFIDTKDSIVIPFIFDEIRPFKKGLAAIEMKNKWGFINRRGDIVILPTYTSVYEFVGNMVVVTQGSKQGVIDKNGLQVLEPKFDRVRIYNDSLLFVGNWVNLNLEWVEGVYDTKGNELIPLIYDEVDRYTYTTTRSVVNGKIVEPERPNLDYLKVKYKGKWGIINLRNEVISPFKYESRDCIGDFEKNYARVKINEKWGIIDTNGIEIIKPSYGKIGEISKDHLFSVKIKDKWGIIDTSNNVIIPIEYEKVEFLGKKFVAAKKNGKWGVLDYDNQVVCEFKYDAMGSEVGNYTIVLPNKNFKGELRVNVRNKGGKVFMINEFCEEYRNYWE